MTTLTTIIEEEKKVAQAKYKETEDNPSLNFSDVLDTILTTAMHRAYKAGEEAGEERLQKAREEERKKLFKNPLELFRGNRIKMTMETREALLGAIDIVPDHPELDQNKQ